MVRTKDPEPEVEEMVVPGRWKEVAPGKVTWEQGYSSEICDQHGDNIHLMHPTATGWSCEHKTVTLKSPLGVKPVDSEAVQAVSPGDLRQQAAAIIAQAEALELAAGGH